jgi:hypothetical protein
VLPFLAFAPFGSGERSDAFPGGKVTLRHEIEALLCSERVRTGGGEEHVGRVLHHGTGNANRISCAPHSRHSASPHRRPVHDRCVELVLAVSVQDCTVSGIKKRAVFENDDSRCNRVQARAAVGEYLVSRPQRFAQGAVIRHIAGARQACR